MKILGDYHTHTNFSHGSGSVLKNAESAKQKGLKEIAITDHGFGHRLYAVKRSKFASVIADAKNAETTTGVKVLVGIEANFLSEQGDIDLTPEEIKNLDEILEYENYTDVESDEEPIIERYTARRIPFPFPCNVSAAP